MTLDDFAAFHSPALLEDEIRYAQVQAQIDQARRKGDMSFRFWSLGPPGACAVLTKGRPVALGRVEHGHCVALARELAGQDYLGVAGIGEAPRWFKEAAQALGRTFRTRMVMHVMELRQPPVFPGAPGAARLAVASDFDWVLEARLGFHRDLAPGDPPLDRDAAVTLTAERRHSLWIHEGERVSIATEARVMPASLTIGGVYTPPPWRGRGFAGSAVASLAALAFAEGKRAASLWADVANPISNRCYAKIGFKAVDLLTDFRLVD